MIAALSATTLVSACGSSASPTTTTSSTAASFTPTAILNMRTIVRSIEVSILTQRHIHAKVTCPLVVPEQKGRNFACIAHVHGSKAKTPVAVTQQNNDGYVTYRVE